MDFPRNRMKKFNSNQYIKKEDMSTVYIGKTIYILYLKKSVESLGMFLVILLKPKYLGFV